MAKGWYDVLRYHVVPPVFLVVFTFLSQILAWVGTSQAIRQKALESHQSSWLQVYLDTALGNRFSWQCLGALILWSWIWLRISSKIYYGPPTSFGYKPYYKKNGVIYYLITISVYVGIQLWDPTFSTRIYNNMPYIMGSLQLFALLFCTLLWIKGRIMPDHTADVTLNLPWFYEFYRGIETHPRLLGVDIKQWTNCRMGMILWQLLTMAFFFASRDNYGFNMGMFVNLLLQTVYLCKFFYWETGYFLTLDIILDRAGYYICWGCLVWVPALYTFSSYYLVANEPILSDITAIGFGIIGGIAIILNYLSDLERMLFRQAGEKRVYLWGRVAKYIPAKYQDSKGNTHNTRLLISGAWGLARHMNYFFELLAAFSWSVCGWGHIWPFSYFIFLTILLVHRIFRDEEKCRRKYGADWDIYCSIVKYRMIPYIF